MPVNNISLTWRGFIATLALLIISSTSSAQQTTPAETPTEELEVVSELDQLKASIADDLSVNAGNVLVFSMPKFGTDLPTVRFGTNDLLILEGLNSWHIVCGIPLNTLPGQYLIYYRHSNDEQDALAIHFDVKAPANQLLELFNPLDQHSVLAESLTNLPSSVLDFENSGEPTLPLMWPLDTQWNDAFGAYLDDTSLQTQQQWYTAQIPVDTEIRAPSNGLVSNVVNNPESDQSVLILDHGRGLFSVFNTLGTWSQQLGTGVKQGQGLELQLRESTDDAVDTQHILQWQVRLNNTVVNPQQFIDWKLPLK